MPRQLSEAEIEQRRDAAKKRWADAAMVAGMTAASGYGGYKAAGTLAARRLPNRAETYQGWRKWAKTEAGQMKREGVPIAERAQVLRGTRREAMKEIAGRLRPASNRRARVAAGVAAALLGGGSTLTAREADRLREADVQIPAREAALFGTLAVAGGALKGGLPTLEVASMVREHREARGKPFNVSRGRLAGIAATGAGAGALYFGTKDS